MGPGDGQGCPNTDSLQALERNLHVQEAAANFVLTAFLFMGASVNFHGGSLPKLLVCLCCLMGMEHGGGVGP